MKRKCLFYIFALAGFMVFSALASEAEEPAMIAEVPWAAYTLLPSKNYVVVGTAILRNVNPATLLADIMDQAVAMGGHDIKNVRLLVSRAGEDKQINVATAVVIRYTDETIMVAVRNNVGLDALADTVVIEAALPEIEIVDAAPEARPRRRIWPTILGGVAGLILIGLVL